MSTSEKRISNFILLRILFRSFFIQAAWNFEKMQNLGFIYCMMPALKKIYGDKKEELQLALKRHLTFFNTHPYLSAVILGVTINLEESYKNTGTGLEKINNFKNSMMGICGSLGDSFFWGGLRPIIATCIVILLSIFSNLYVVLAGFILYNIIQITFRAYTFFSGYYKGIIIVDALKKMDLKTQAERLKKVHAVLIGLLLAFTTLSIAPLRQIRTPPVILLINPDAVVDSFYNITTYFFDFAIMSSILFGGYYLIKKKNLSPLLIFYIITAIILLLSYIFLPKEV